MADVRQTWVSGFQRTPREWTGTIQFDVIGVTNASDACDEVMAFAGYTDDQANLTTHPQNPLLYFAGLTPQQEGFRHWIVTAKFSSTSMGTFPNPNNPLNDLTEWQWGIGCVQEAVDHDAYGNPILNTALAPITGATRSFSTVSFTATRNEPIYNPQIALDYVNHVNKLAFTIMGVTNIAAGVMLLRSYQPIISSTINSLYVKCQYLFEARAPFKTSVDADGLFDSWKTRIINKSRIGWYTDGSGNKQRGYFGRGTLNSVTGFTETSEDVLIGTNGIPLQMPGESSKWYVLDALSGAQTPVAAPGTLPATVAKDTDATTGVVFLKYTMFPPVDFAGLNL